MKTLTKYFFTLSFGLALPLLSAQAQNGKFYSTEQGLSSSLINYLLQDDRGYIWVATEYGLNRFDGNRFTTYFHHEKDSTSISSNYVHTLFEDSHHHLYVGCINGLSEYRRATDDFRPIPLMNGTHSVKAHITRILETPDHRIYFSTTGQGLFELDADEGVARYISEEWNMKEFPYMAYIYQDKHEDFWLGTNGYGALMHAKDQSAPVRYQQPDVPDGFVVRMGEDPQGRLFLGTLNRGLVRFHPDTKTFTPVVDPSHPEDYSIVSLGTTDSLLLVGTDGQGLKTYDASRDALTDFVSSSSPIDLHDTKVHAILTDRDGNLWLGLFQKGIVLIPKQDNPFTYYGPKSAYYNPIGNSCVMSVCRDSRGHLWVGTDHDGLYELDAHGQRLHHYASDRTRSTVPYTIMSITEDSNHRLWLGSFGQGVACFDPQTGACHYLPFLDNVPVMSVTEDATKHLYIATSAGGFYRYSLTDQSYTQYKSTRDGKNDLQRNELANDWVNRLFLDRQGRLWLGHYAGISCFDPAKESFTALGGKNLLISGCIGYAFMEDREGYIWAGTSQGLYRIDPRTGTSALLTTDDGLCNNVVGGLCEDAQGHLWISTFRGMSQYDPRKKTFVNFYAGDGLQGNEFTLGAYFQADDGRCYFGGVDGVTTFLPHEIEAAEPTLRVWITDFQIDNEPVNRNTLSNGHPIIDGCVEDAERFHLSYLDNSFSLTLSTLQYDNANQIGYQYRMDGINRDWVSTDPGTNSIRYNKLPAGTYTLHVRALVRGHLTEERTVTIVIDAPWYRTGWAYMLYALALLLIAYGVLTYLRLRIRRKRELLAQQQTDRINEAKLQFVINIAHEIRTPMTLIISPLERLMADEQMGERYHTFQMIHRNAQRILRLINQLMDVRKLDKGQMQMKFSEVNMVDFLGDGIQPFESLAKKKQIALSFVHPMDHLNVWVDLNNFDKVMMNLISNAFKFTPSGGSIDVSLTTGSDASRNDALAHYFEIDITDSGMGIPEDQLDRIFDRFYQLDNSVTKATAGTGVGLHLSRQLVKLHHGLIYAENRTDRSGARFIVRLPLGKDHLKPEEMEQDTMIPIVTMRDSIHRLVTDVNTDPDPRPTYGETTRRSLSLPLLLIAEDDEEIAHYLRDEFQKDYRVTIVSNGKDALQTLLRHHPDLVISDVMMPEMDGLTLCHKIKQNTEVNHTPVVLLTARTRPEDTREGMEQGADAYVTKPFSIDTLRATVSNLLENRRLLRSKFSGAQQQQDKVEHLEMKSGDEQLMERIMKVINKHLDDPELSVEMLSTEVGISRVHIHRKLKEITNQTTRDFIKNIRLQQAVSLMKQHQGLTVSDIAYRVGFSNLSHFSTSFKEKYGLSPKDYMIELPEEKEM